MKNTLLKFNTTDVDINVGDHNIVKAPDYFSKAIDIYNLFEEVNDMIDIYQMVDNDKLERISYEIYGTTDYWDLILVLNDRNPLFEMPYDDGVLDEAALKSINYYKNFIYSHAPLLQERANDLYQEFLLQTKTNNENFRFVYVIKPSRINDFISLIKSKGYI